MKPLFPYQYFLDQNGLSMLIINYPKGLEFSKTLTRNSAWSGYMKAGTVIPKIGSKNQAVKAKGVSLLGLKLFEKGAIQMRK